jgi:hypothetical protein
MRREGLDSQWMAKRSLVLRFLFAEQPTRLPKIITLILDAGNGRRDRESINVDQEIKGHVIVGGRCLCDIEFDAGIYR